MRHEEIRMKATHFCASYFLNFGKAFYNPQYFMLLWIHTHFFLLLFVQWKWCWISYLGHHGTSWQYLRICVFKDRDKGCQTRAWDHNHLTICTKLWGRLWISAGHRMFWFLIGVRGPPAELQFVLIFWVIAILTNEEYDKYEEWDLINSKYIFWTSETSLRNSKHTSFLFFPQLIFEVIKIKSG